MARGDVLDGDAGTSNTGTQGTRECKCDISFFVKMCYLYMVNIRFHYDVYTKHFFLVIGVKVDFHCRVIFPCVRA